MRRFVASLASVVGTLVLGACSGGGSVLGSGAVSPDHVIVTVQGPTNVARVLPGAGLPISAVAVRGTQNGILSTTSFRWSGALTSGMTYPSDAFGTMKPCATVNVVRGGVTQPYVDDFGIYIAIDPTNESNIEFIPPTVIPVPSGASAIQVHYPYCVVISATPGSISGTGLGTHFTQIGPPGSLVIQVVDPQDPLQ